MAIQTTAARDLGLEGISLDMVIFNADLAEMSISLGLSRAWATVTTCMHSSRLSCRLRGSLIRTWLLVCALDDGIAHTNVSSCRRI